jgi:hypothetical protein
MYHAPIYYDVYYKQNQVLLFFFFFLH